MAIKMLQKARKKSTDKAHDKPMTQKLQIGQLAYAELAALKRSRKGAYSEITHIVAPIDIPWSSSQIEPKAG